MTKEEEMQSAQDKIIKALEQQSDDCVSRQAVKEGMIKYGFRAPDMTVTEFVEDELSPVTPTHGTCTKLKAFSNKLKGRMKSRDEDNGGEPLNAIDRGYHLAFEHLCEEIDSLLADFEKRGSENEVN